MFELGLSIQFREWLKKEAGGGEFRGSVWASEMGHG
jgi:hypothetical protein